MAVEAEEESKTLGTCAAEGMADVDDDKGLHHNSTLAERSLHCCISARREVAEAREEDRRVINRFGGVDPLESWYVLLVFPIRLYYA